MVIIAEYRVREWFHACIYHEDDLASRKMVINVYDYLDYLKMMHKAGILGAWIHKFPGCHLDATPRQMKEAVGLIKKFKRILRCLTEKESLRPDMMVLERRKWICYKSKVSIDDMRLLLERYEDMRFYARIYKSRI